MNYKIKVGSEAESKEVQGLFFELGYKWFSGEKKAQHLEQSCSSSFGYLVAWSSGCFTNVIQCGCGDEDAKEITIPQLKDMVVLKRNNPKDSTHYRGDGKEYFQTHDKERHYHFQDGEWVLSTWMNYQLLPQLKPITKEFLAKDESGSYFLFNSEYPKASEWIEVPEGALMLIHHPNGREVWSYSGSKVNPLNTVLWQRHTKPEAPPFIDDEPKYDREETLNDKVASAEVARQEFIGVPFDDSPEFNFEAVDVVDAEFFPDNVNQPSHYCSHPSGIECIEITRHHDFAIGNAIKYLWRAGLKDSADEIQDLEKASWYIQDKINQLKKLNENSSKD